MPKIKFDDEWEALPEIYKARFLEIIEERGLAAEFDLLPDEYKSQILGIIKEHVLGDMKADADPGIPRASNSSD